MDPPAPSVQDDTPSWLNKGFLEDILRREEADDGLVVDDVELKPVVEKGDNYASVVHKVLVGYHRGDGVGERRKKSVVIKSLPGNEVMQRFAKDFHLFDKEMYAYTSLLPAMKRLTGSPPASARFFSTERPYTIVLEDISARGFKMADRRAGLDLQHCLLALRTLAQFHALSVEVVRRDPGVVERVPESLYSERAREMNRSYVPAVYNSLADIVESWPGYERFGDKIRSMGGTVVEELEDQVVPEKDGFNVVNHGDFWVNNMMFRYSEETQAVEEVCMIDLQVLRYGSPALDLHYFLATSPAEGVREEHEDALLVAYHSALRETLEALGLEQQVFTLEQLKKAFADKMVFGFNVGCVVLSAVVADPSDAIDLDSLTEEALEIGDVNVMAKAIRGQRYKGALQRLLLYFEKKGAI